MAGALEISLNANIIFLKSRHLHLLAYVSINLSTLPLDDVLWIDFFAAILNEAFRAPNHKTLF